MQNGEDDVDAEWGHWVPTVDQQKALVELLTLIGREVSRVERAKRRRR